MRDAKRVVQMILDDLAGCQRNTTNTQVLLNIIWIRTYHNRRRRSVFHVFPPDCTNCANKMSITPTYAHTNRTICNNWIFFKDETKLCPRGVKTKKFCTRELRKSELKQSGHAIMPSENGERNNFNTLTHTSSELPCNEK